MQITCESLRWSNICWWTFSNSFSSSSILLSAAVHKPILYVTLKKQQQTLTSSILRTKYHFQKQWSPVLKIVVFSNISENTPLLLCLQQFNQHIWLPFHNWKLYLLNHMHILIQAQGKVVLLSIKIGKIYGGHGEKAPLLKIIVLGSWHLPHQKAARSPQQSPYCHKPNKSCFINEPRYGMGEYFHTIPCTNWEVIRAQMVTRLWAGQYRV